MGDIFFQTSQNIQTLWVIFLGELRAKVKKKGKCFRSECYHLIFMNVPYFNSGLLLQFFDEYFHLVLCMYVTYALLQKSSRQKIWDCCTPFFGMLVFVVCIVACFNEVLLLAFVHYSFTSVSICQNLLIEFGKLSESEDFLWSKVLH